MLNFMLAHCGFIVLGVAVTVVALLALNNGPEAVLRPHRERSPKRSARRRRGSHESPSQRDIMTDELRAARLKCSICLSHIGSDDSIFVCRETCYNIFHQSCIRKWASARTRGSWNCPHCFHQYNYFPPTINLCLCGQTENPAPLPGVTPHCCQKKCKCGVLCHPGSCSTE